MILRYILLLLITILGVNIPNNNSFAKKRKKKTKSSFNKKKKKKKKIQVKQKPGIKQKKQVTKETKNEKEDQNIKKELTDKDFKKQKDRMSINQFKDLIEFWNRYHLIHKDLPRQTAIKEKYKNELSKAKRLKEKLDNLRNIDNSNLDKIKSLEERIEAIKKEIERLKNLNPKKRRQKKKINAKIKELEIELKKLMNELEEERNKHKINQSNIGDLKNEIEEIEEFTEKKQKISEAELLFMESLDTSDLTEEQRKVVESLRNKIQKIINGYENTGKLDKNQYSELAKLMQELISILRKYAKGQKQTLDYRERIAKLESLINDLEEAYKTNGRLDKEQLSKTIAILKGDLKIWKNIDSNNIKQIIHKGLVFKVQIGAYRTRDLAKIGDVASEEDNLLEQEDEKDIHQYTLRTFRNYWKADEFKKQMRAMGVKDAYIISVIDGKRVPLKKVLEDVKKQKIKKS